MDSYLRALSPSSTVDSSDEGTSDAEHIFSGRWDLLGDWRSMDNEYSGYSHTFRAFAEAFDSQDSEDDVSDLSSDDDNTATFEPQEHVESQWRRPRRHIAAALWFSDSSSEDTNDDDVDDDEDDDEEDEEDEEEDKEEESNVSNEIVDLQSEEEMEQYDDEEEEDDDDDDDEEEDESSYTGPHLSATPSELDPVVLVWNHDYSTYTLRRAQSLSPPASPALTSEARLSAPLTVTTDTPAENSVSYQLPASPTIAGLRNTVSRPSSLDTIGRTSPGMMQHDDNDVETLFPSYTPGHQQSGNADDEPSNHPPTASVTTNNNSNTNVGHGRGRSGFGGAFQRNRGRIASPRLMQTLRRRQRFQPWSSNGSTALDEIQHPPSSSSSSLLREQSATTPSTSDSDPQSSEAPSAISSPLPSTPFPSSSSSAIKAVSADDGGGSLVLGRAAVDTTTGWKAPLIRSAGTNGRTVAETSAHLMVPHSRLYTQGWLPLHAISQPHRHTWWQRHVPSTGLTMAIPMSSQTKALKKHQRPCIFLQAGQEFRGTQNLTSRSVQATRASATNRNSQMEEWDVKVTISAVDYASGTVYGLMEAMDVPMSSSNVITYWEGEIVDFQNNDLWTRKWSTLSRTDIEHWKRLEAFRGLDERAIVRGAKTGKFRGHLRQRYIFMRWKEKHFINATEHTNGLTIAGFYYIALRRSDGTVEGYYHDRQSTPFQRLCLHPHYALPGQPSAKFEFA